MTVIKRSSYVSDSKCDAMVANLPTFTTYLGGHCMVDEGGDKISVYQFIKWRAYPEALKTAWKDAMPSEVVDTYLVSSFLKIPANTGVLYPTTLATEGERPIGCFLSVSLKDGQNLKINGTKYDVSKGDALIFNATDTYETEIMSSDALWSVNMIPAWKKSTYAT